MAINNLLGPRDQNQIEKDLLSLSPKEQWEQGVKAGVKKGILYAILGGYWPKWPGQAAAAFRMFTPQEMEKLTPFQDFFDNTSNAKLFQIAIEHGNAYVLKKALEKGFKPTKNQIGKIYGNIKHEELEELTPYLGDKFQKQPLLRDLSDEEREEDMTKAWEKIMSTGLVKNAGTNRQWKNGSLAFKLPGYEEMDKGSSRNWNTRLTISRNGYIRQRREGKNYMNNPLSFGTILHVNPRASYEDLADWVVEYIEKRKRLAMKKEKKLVSESLNEMIGPIVGQIAKQAAVGAVTNAISKKFESGEEEELEEFVVGPNVDMHESDDPRLQVIMKKKAPSVFGQDAMDVFTNFYEVKRGDETILFVKVDFDESKTFTDAEGNVLETDEVMAEYPQLGDPNAVDQIQESVDHIDEDHVPYRADEFDEDDLREIVDSVDLQVIADFLQTIYDRPVDWEYVSQNPQSAEKVLWQGLEAGDFSMDEFVEFAMDLPTEMGGPEGEIDDDDLIAY